jgi:hypothetical protein
VSAESAATVGPPPPPASGWLKRHRILLLVYVVGLFFGVREYLIKRDQPRFEWETPEGVALLELLEQLNPDDPDTHYLKAMHALAEGDRAEFDRRLGLVLASDMKHNELMLKFHAEYLLATSTDTAAINAAITRWRRNFPYTTVPITFRLPTGPRTRPQAEALERAIADIPWVADSRLGRSVDGAREQWIVGVLIRRATEIDVRDLSRALERLLSL